MSMFNLLKRSPWKGRARRRPFKGYSKSPSGRAARALLSVAARRSLRRRTVNNLRSGGFSDLEVKFLDTSLIGSTINSTTDASGGEQDPTTVNCLNPIAQGDGESNRDGRKATMHSIFISGQVYTEPVSATGNATEETFVYLALVLDTQTNVAQLDLETVFTNPGASADTAPFPLRNLQYTQRFRILAQKKLVLKPPSIAYGGGVEGDVDSNGVASHFKIYRKFNLPVIFNGTTGNVNTIADNSLHLIAYADKGGPKISYNSRVRFTG